MSTKRTPDEIMRELHDFCVIDEDREQMDALIREVVSDVLYAVDMAVGIYQLGPRGKEAADEVRDYVTNHYGH